MRIIQSHSTWFPAYTERVPELPEAREELLSGIEENPGRVGSGPSFLLNAQIALTVDPEAAAIETWYAWTSAMQLYHAMFAVSATPEGETIECLIDQRVRVLKGMGPQYFANPGNWLTAFYLALTCRDKKRWIELANFPIEVLREQAEKGGSHFGRHTYHWISALQSMILNRPESMFSELEKAIELSDPRSGALGGDILDKLVFPEMNVFRCLVEGDVEGFNNALAQGLELFKDYYTEDEERSEDINGTVPLGLLAFSCLVYDRNRKRGDFPIEIESTYLPKFILNAAWYGEFAV
ncbi:immunity protein 49 of polymorphic toxin system [Nocardiopsis sp. Huas11]|uniref:immunity 49 family protein n=1 Tax=Nocardiopsis sp. Huas11 TaxID=2183912 RepID=UPI000EAF70DA|nr:immunity 49 family protein [Nocardiopsis sp. Huas11]RKS10773.1 immunity protein 49 of polymorphic toxin system [Nocardiopsis sp. Huas11]